MAKKIFWKDNTIPLTNHIWAKTDDNGNVTGIYEHDRNKWVLVKTPQTGDGVPNTIAMRDGRGNLKTGTPVENNDCVPLQSFSWIEV